MIGKLSTSIVHDLRNLLAAIYGGAEMLADSDLPPAQSKRLALNIYPVSRRDSLFQPFVSAGKRNGLGLGLALARQTALDHGGDLIN